MISLRRPLAALFLAAAPVCVKADSTDSKIAVPFSYIRHEIVVTGRIAGTGPFAFLLDTDTTPSAMDLALAKKLRLHFYGESGTASGIGSKKSKVRPVTIDRLEIGALRVPRVEALAIDLSALRSHFHVPIVAVLGTSLFAGRVVQIDYACRTFTFLRRSTGEAFTARFRTAADSGQNVSDDVRLGPQRVSATFDTGDSGFSFVTHKGIAELHMQEAARNGRAASGFGYNGDTKATSGVLNGLKIGTVRIGTVATTFLPSVRDPFDLNIGNQTLSGFVVTFDYQRNRLTLTRKPARERLRCR